MYANIETFLIEIIESVSSNIIPPVFRRMNDLYIFKDVGFGLRIGYRIFSLQVTLFKVSRTFCCNAAELRETY